MFTHVITILCLRQLDFNEVIGEKSRWELHKGTARCFEQILEATPLKIPAAQPLSSHLTSQLRRAKHAWH